MTRSVSSLTALLTGLVLVSGCANNDDVALKQGARDAGRAVGTATREVGQGAKTATKTIGHATRDGVKAVGAAAKEGAQEFKRTVSEKE